MGLPLILAIRAAEPAVEPKSIDPALRNSSALLEPADCTQTMRMPSLANSFSSSPFCLRIIDTGLYVAQSRWISFGASAADAPPGISAETAMTAAKARREILNIVEISTGMGRSKQMAERRQRRRIDRKASSPAKTSFYFN